MRTRHRRLFCLTTLALIALGLGLAGCAWVTDAFQHQGTYRGRRGEIEDSNGNTGTTTTGAGGLYAFDAAAKGQAIPAVGSMM